MLGIIRSMDGRGRLIAGAIASAGVVAATAFSGSYQHQYTLLIRFGQAHWYAAVQPLSVEGLVVTATLMMALAAQLRKSALAIWPAYLALVLGISQAALMNVASSHFDWWWLGIEINVWPAVAFAAAYEMTVWMLRHRAEGKVNEGQDTSVAPPTPDVPVPPLVLPKVVPTRDPFVPEEVEIPDSDDLPDDEPEVTGLAIELVKPINLVNGSEPVHTCNGGSGPKGGKKTPGCPRCDAIVAGLIAPKGQRRR